MSKRNIVILGSTGSIGRSTIEVLEAHADCFNVCALAAHSNVELLVSQAKKLHPEYVCVVDESKASLLTEQLSDQSVTVLAGEEELVRLASLSEAEMIVNAVVGAAGLRASLAAVEKGKALALANKESLVAGGPLFPALMEKSGGTILPIDSEHSAIWQALACGRKEEVRKIIITASGGPFREYPLEQFDDITKDQALNHPTWKMGPKITIDSATLANKGLEVIEAVALFQVPVEQIEVVIHPQSIVHSMVEFVDSSILAQLSTPDMRLPITNALFWPERVESDFGRLDMSNLNRLTFEPPDLNRFEALKIAFEVAAVGGTAPAVFNAANEVAVAAFLDGRIKFGQIGRVIAEAVDKLTIVSGPTLSDILEADSLARKEAAHLAGLK
ncbi:MAG: 1-deoxy-D-xylulose-5-phosphate reductoisomerase [candidate division Zixibacteria bacterium]|nr:1-deoxy-D-xylulose-5-phosphate reductoisomerase [candidate division Zixibacteria bacterium]MDH3937203.1 1-deoxy-D-xylulose-5-phosphate reductoisomerase [candidate division Zixibacteria bacterium]MDH4034571.1 1-deoxy-D-xylulose-5-phosphate reductoisomerase [candidate division Zixibacteria bacterium]